MSFWFSFIYALGFTAIHFATKYMKFIKDVPRSRFLSFAGGIAVSYVFIHLLPELNHHQAILEEALNHKEFSFIERHAYLVSLIGLAIFYGLEKMVKVSKVKAKSTPTDHGVFWIHISSFFIYNAIIGYLLIKENDNNLWGMFFYFLAFSVHFITNDFSLRKDHKKIYDKYGRWLLSAAIIIGWFIGVITEVNELVISLLVAFLAGGIILNVLKEELPEERESSFGAFTIGLIGYALLLLVS